MADTTVCSFCGATNVKMIQGMRGNICFECISTCNETVNKIKTNKTTIRKTKQN